MPKMLHDVMLDKHKSGQSRASSGIRQNSFYAEIACCLRIKIVAKSHQKLLEVKIGNLESPAPKAPKTALQGMSDL